MTEEILQLLSIPTAKEQSLLERFKSQGGGFIFYHLCCVLEAEPHSSVGSIADLRTGGRWFDARLGQYSFRGLMSHCNRIHSSLPTFHCFNNGYQGKQPVAWTEYCTEYWLKELQESMDRCIGCCNITEILLKKALSTIQSISVFRRKQKILT